MVGHKNTLDENMEIGNLNKGSLPDGKVTKIWTSSSVPSGPRPPSQVPRPCQLGKLTNYRPPASTDTVGDVLSLNWPCTPKIGRFIIKLILFKTPLIAPDRTSHSL